MAPWGAMSRGLAEKPRINVDAGPGECCNIDQIAVAGRWIVKKCKFPALRYIA